jgi:hypothetical protein
MARGEVRDPVHGFIFREPVENLIIDSPAFQRLRGIRQLALAALVYPGATHTRFDHSLGTMHVAGKIAESIGLEAAEVRLVRLAALLHDIGHGPFSHVSEPVLEQFCDRERVSMKRGQQIHEVLSSAIIREDEALRRPLSDVDRDQIIGVLDGTYGDAVLKSIVSGPLDADKQDYLLRDSHFCGVRYGVYDLERLSHCLAVHPDPDDRYLAITEDGVHALEQFVLAKYYMTTQVYRHKVRLISDAMIQRALELGIAVDGIAWLKALFAFDGSSDYVREYKTWTDDRLVDRMLFGETPDGYAKTLFRNLQERRLHKRVASYQMVEFTDPLVREFLAELEKKREDRIELERRIGGYLAVDPQLIIVNTFTIKSVREQAKNTEASILVLRPEGPVNFEEVSTLFRSIDQAIRDQYLEVYAPIRYRDEREKKRLKAQYQTEIRELTVAFAREKTAEGGAEE